MTSLRGTDVRASIGRLALSRSDECEQRTTRMLIRELAIVPALRKRDVIKIISSSSKHSESFLDRDTDPHFERP